MRGGVTFDALGQPYEVRFTTNAICRIEEKTGRSIEDVFADTALPNKRTLTRRMLMWAGVGGITMEQAGEIMDDLGLAEVDRIIAEGVRMAFPPRDGTPEGDAGNEAATAV